ncbi:alpha-N-arabinofuranosidase [Paenibacillus helianthi]|uniref:Alpha-N-arabinofuranosidase n=1 Tax=Paenibacillus helianthi TaxID=1349432 RepID=A0ABX3EJB1_9BACL|nr:alpha-N-arabinofuranosidase [Paenibacillus helianthi]
MFNKQGYNPYLPSWEYTPDGEPHVFNNRVYVYGSHDRFNGYTYCLNDYVCWSAPTDDLTDWRYEGVIYKKTDDPKNTDGEMCLYAPDVTKGTNGRYYLYYVLDKRHTVSVAVCDSPAGKYDYYGEVHYKDGELLGDKPGDEPQFDPGVLVEEENVYLYTGSCTSGDPSRKGPMATVLEPDMVTVKEGPVTIAPSEPYSKGSGFEGHEFFEASSIRKIGDTYYFIYSSVLYHELCYATSQDPTKGFVYRGTIVSNNDSFIDTYKPAELPMNYGGNNHGSIVQIKDRWYVFYHRHTNGTNYSRQGCLEPIVILEDGTIPQVEMTSCGPNGGPLIAKGEYPAYLACHLFCKDTAALTAGPGDWMNSRFPKITQDGKDGDEEAGYIANMRDGATAGFKYFDCRNVSRIKIKVRGGYGGVFEIATTWNGSPIGAIPVGSTNEWKEYSAHISIPDGVHALYFKYVGLSFASLAAFALE